MRTALKLGRLLTAAGILAAVAAQLARSISVWRERGDSRIDLEIANFFSFFTIQSNLIGAVVLALAAGWLSRAGALPRWLALLQLAATTYLLTTGVVYNTLLRGIDLPQGATVGWSNEVLHVAAPALLLVDWGLSGRARERPRLGWRALVAVASYPLLWLTVTMLRGPLIPNELTGEPFWYPYPFLDPNANGWASVAGTGLGIAVVVLAVAALLVLIDRRSSGRGVPSPGRAARYPK